MKQAVFVITLLAALAGCSTMETATNVDARVAERALTTKPVTLHRIDGRTQTVRIADVRTDIIAVRHGNGDYEELPYSAIESMKYSRVDMVRSGLLIGAGLAFITAGASTVPPTPSP